MSIRRAQAWQQLCLWTESDALHIHARSVELVMRAAAHHYGAGEADEETWGIAGLLHDADYERWPEEHPDKIVAWLRELDEPELAHAISAHHTGWGKSYDSLLDKALLACDELTGFVGAKSVLKKLKSLRFAAKVDRGEVHAGAAMLGVDLREHVQFVIDALKPHAEELGIGGHGGVQP